MSKDNNTKTVESDEAGNKIYRNIPVLKFIGGNQVCILFEGKPKIAVIEAPPTFYKDGEPDFDLKVSAGAGCKATIVKTKVDNRSAVSLRSDLEF